MCIVFFSLCELAVLVQAVTDTVVSICQCRCLLVVFQIDILAETVLCLSVFFEFEITISQVIMGQCVHIRIPLAGVVQISAVI